MKLKAWRRVAIPHEDVSAGRYQQAEFAADLAQVLMGDAVPEYQDASEFFARTYLTEGMKRLLKTSLDRIDGSGGEPVVKLKTSFGGGKTHTMLAIYHLFGGADPKSLQGISDLLNEVEIKTVPKCKIAILVGTALDPSRPRIHSELDGLTTNTLWGEMATQLGGKEGYELVKNADENGVAPGSDTLVELFNRNGPCIVLIDELVAYARNIYHVSNLPGGSFDSNMTFIQNLTEAAKRSNKSLVVASIPESNIEIGGEGGQAALERLENTFGRLEAIWQPVGQLESFEIVRRRIFARIESEKDRDATCSSFYNMYKEQSNDFPIKCKEKEYLDRLKASYPFHPEFFDRLYEDWATLEKFQRTRGVLRLTAAVVHELWSKNDQSPMIMPGNLPLYAPKIRDELTRYLGEQWPIIVDKDVDGEQSEPYRVDKDNTRIGSIMAARRVARTIFLGSAPSVRQQSVRGIEDIRIRLGVAQPEEITSIYADALSRLTDRLTYLYHDNKRYWYDTRPNLIRTVEDRAVQWDSVDVENELRFYLLDFKDKSVFSRVHVMCEPNEIPDEMEVRLVILGPRDAYWNDKVGLESPALQKAKIILESKGTGSREYRNTLLFLAPDANAIDGCQKEIRRHLSWKSVLIDEEKLGLDSAQKRQAKEQVEKSKQSVKMRLSESYSWLLTPYQEVVNGKVVNEIKWDLTKVNNITEESMVIRAGKKALKDQKLIKEWSPILLKMELDKLLWKDNDWINLKQLWEYLATYLYLPRLSNEKVLIDTIRAGLSSDDFFAYAVGMDSNGKFLGMIWKTPNAGILIDGSSLLLRCEVARKVLDAKTPDIKIKLDSGESSVQMGEEKGLILEKGIKSIKLKRFHGSITLDPQRVGRDASQIAEEVIAHLAGLPDAEVIVNLEIQVRVPNGAPENIVRIVTENAKTLKFKNQEFEEE